MNSDQHDRPSEQEKNAGETYSYLDEKRPMFPDTEEPAAAGGVDPLATRPAPRAWLSRAISVLWLLTIVIPFVCFFIQMISVPVSGLALATYRSDMYMHKYEYRKNASTGQRMRVPTDKERPVYTAKLGLMGYCTPAGCGWGPEPEVQKAQGKYYHRETYSERGMWINGVCTLGATLSLGMAFVVVRRNPFRAYLHQLLAIACVLVMLAFGTAAHADSMRDTRPTTLGMTTIITGTVTLFVAQIPFVFLAIAVGAAELLSHMGPQMQEMGDVWREMRDARAQRAAGRQPPV